jgi:stage II sporulation SpoAA-like protein
VETQLQVDGASRVVIVTVSGVLGDAELQSLGDQLEKNPEVAPDFALLIDLRQADGKSVTSAGVRSLATRALVFAAASKRAVVVPSDLGFGMARMYEMLREGRGGGMRVFRDYEEARRWVAQRS